MKKRLSALLACTLLAGTLAACGGSSSVAGEATAADTPSAAQQQDGPTGADAPAGTDRSKITVMLESSESHEAYRVWSKLFDGFIEEQYPDLEVEYELIPNDGDYANKLQLYIASNQLPDFYACANGTFSAAAKEIDAMVNIGKELQKIDKYEAMNDAVIDFLTDADDGELYLFPQALYCEFFFYRTDIFEELGLEVPTTWNEFLNVCEQLQAAGEVPVIIAGGDQWQIMRYLSFAPWRVTHDGFVMGYIDQTTSFADNSAAQVGVNLVQTMGDKGYWQPGFTSTNYTDATNLFFNGTGAIFYSGSGHIANAMDMYDAGQLGIFPVPAVDGEENISTDVPIHAGFALAFNKQTYDEVMQDFFAYICDHFTEVAYSEGLFSAFEDDPPSGLHDLFYAIEPLFEDAEHSWVSWDDKLDSATVVQMEDAQEELALGMITPEEFIAEMDEAVKVNNPK